MLFFTPVEIMKSEEMSLLYSMLGEIWRLELVLRKFSNPNTS